MKATLVLSMGLLLAWAATGMAQDNAAQPPAPTAQQLKAQMHRAMADLVEAQAAAQPDQAKIDQLAEQLQSIRRQLWAKAPAAGRGQGWAGQGRGWGRGPAYGGRGYGCPWGGPGGYGRGWGRGMGMGPGRGMGPGMGFVDEDGDGVCDYFQPPAATKK